MVAKEHKDMLEQIKKDVENSVSYFKPSFARFTSCRNFAYNSNLSQDDIQALQALNKPQLEINLLPSFINRVVGNFTKQIPGVKVGPSEDQMSPANPVLYQIIEGHLGFCLDEANRNNFSVDIFTDLLTGGLSVAKVWTEYKSSSSWDQVIKIGRVYDPTLCGFDQLARLPSKADGRFCFEYFPTRKSDFKKEHPDLDLSSLKFIRGDQLFNWSYSTQKEDILIQCYYYRKKFKKKKLLLLTDGSSVFEDQYEKLLQRWNENKNLAQPPLVKQERMVKTEYICRYHLIGCEILEYEEMDFPNFPLIYFGKEILNRESIEAPIKPLTVPYIKSAIDAQKLFNFSAQTVANELENMVMQKFKAPLEGIPIQDEYAEAYANPQRATVLVYNQFKDSNPDMRLDPPTEITRTGAPAELMATFSSAPQLMQTVLGAFDSVQSLSNTDISGEAIVQASTQADAVAQPWVHDFIIGLQAVLQLYVDLMPKYYLNKMILPTKDFNGQKQMVGINDNLEQTLNYNSGELKVNVTPGLNSEIQKQRSLQMMAMLSKQFPVFGQMIQQTGLGIILENCDFHGIEQLKAQLPKYMQQVQQQQQMASQMNPMALKYAELQQKSQQDQAENALKQQELELDRQDLANDMLKIMADSNNTREDMAVQTKKANVEQEVNKQKHDLEVHKHQFEILNKGLDLAHKIAAPHPSSYMEIKQ